MGLDIIVLCWPAYLSELFTDRNVYPNLLKAGKNANTRAVLRNKYYMFSIQISTLN